MRKAPRHQSPDIPPPKKVVIQLGLSCHLVFGKCRHCGGGPDFYYDVRAPIRWYDPRRIHGEYAKYFKRLKRFCYDYYLRNNPSEYFGIAAFTHTPRGTKYNPRIHKNRGVDPVNGSLEFLTCECGRSEWAFNEKAAKTRPEIRERKARYKYPHKFEDRI